jgi:two-component system sensor histidine kinase KdpD
LLAVCAARPPSLNRARPRHPTPPPEPYHWAVAIASRLRGLAVHLRPARPSAGGLALSAATQLAATLLAWLLLGLGVSHAAIVYLLPVVAVGTVFGSRAAIANCLAAFLIYDFLFVRPVHTFAIAALEEWLDLLVFLAVATVIGRLSALQTQRRREAELRTSEARTVYAMSRDVATAAAALEAAPLLATRLAREAEMSRVWIGLGGTVAEERAVADTRPGEPRPPLASRWLLRASTPDELPTWTRVRDTAGSPVRPQGRPERRLEPEELPEVFRAPVVSGSEMLGSVWATRERGQPFPGRSHSRLLAAAADQIGQALVRDRLAAEATAVQVARESDALKSALLDSVSHDLRTPLAGIRAAAGSLMDPAVSPSPAEVRSTAGSIDREAERLSRLVRNMLDLSRIEGGALHPSLELYDLADLAGPVVERLAPKLAPAPVEVEMPADLPAVRADGLFLDQILSNLLENSARHAAGKPIRVSAAAVEGAVELLVEDGGPGVPRATLAHLFERFYQGPRHRGARAEGGSGLGLAVVRGLAEAMGGSVEARQSKLGGLAVAVRLPCEDVAAAEAMPQEIAP